MILQNVYVVHCLKLGAETLKGANYCKLLYTFYETLSLSSKLICRNV